MTRAPILFVLALSLAACGGEKKQQGAGTAEGEVLPGSASDAMLPLDTVTSQPPLAPNSPGEAKSGDKSAKPAPRQSGPADSTAPEPAAAPTAEPPAASATD
ncbi:MAG: hypothetical protein ACKOQ3_06705 [Novosphingobium sp.]